MSLLRDGLQLKLIQAWKGSDDFSWKNCILFAYCFELCHYPVACFTVIPLNRKTGMEKPLHSLSLPRRHCISKYVLHTEKNGTQYFSFGIVSLNLSVFLVILEHPFSFTAHNFYSIFFRKYYNGHLRVQQPYCDNMCCTWWGYFISCFGQAWGEYRVYPMGVPRGFRVNKNALWAFLFVHTWSLPSHAEPLGLPLLSGSSSPQPFSSSRVMEWGTLGSQWLIQG